MEYSDLQVIVQQGVSPVTTNAGDAEAKGIEIDFNLTPNDWLSIDGGIGYIDAEYTQLTTPVGFVNSVDLNNRLINTPEWSFNLGVNIFVPMNGDDELLLHADYLYNGTIANDAPNTPELVQSGTHVLNGSIRYSFNDRYAIAAGVKNITDERYITSGFNQTGVGVIDGVYSRPREWFFTISFKQ